MPRRQPGPTLLRQRALNAAEQLVAQSGASSLTLEAVAHTAGMSKGGLLYHFPSKDALLEAMIERHLNDVESGVTTLATRVVELLDVPHGKQTIAASLLAASATNPRLMERCRAQYARLIQSLEKVPCGFEQAMLLLLAVDGLLLGETMQLSSFTPNQRQRIVAALIDRARDCDASTRR